MSQQNEKTITQATESARARLQHEANQYGAMAEPLVCMQYLFFRSCIQEAHLYALLDQLSTGKMNAGELQKRFVDHANRIASDLAERRGSGKLVNARK